MDPDPAAGSSPTSPGRALLPSKGLYRLLKLAAPFAARMALAAGLSFATIASSIGLMATSAYIISRAALHPSIAELQVAIVGVRFFGISRGLFRYLERYVSHQVTFELLARLRVWFYRALEPLAPARLIQLRSGDLLSRIVADIETLEHFYIRVLGPPAAAVLTLLLIGLLLGSYAASLAVTGIGFLLLAGLGVPLLARRLSRGVGSRLVALRAELNVAIVDGLQGAADLLAYGREAAHLARINRLSREVLRCQDRMAWQAGLHSALSGLLVNLATLAVLVVAIPLVSAGQLDGVYLAVVTLALIASFEAVLPLPAAFQFLESSIAAARRLFEIVDTPPIPPLPEGEGSRVSDGVRAFPEGEASRVSGGVRAFPEGEGSRVSGGVRAFPEGEASRVSGGVREAGQAAGAAQSFHLAVENLWFRYNPGEAPALADVTFQLPPGGRLAVVGASGAGKSTLVNLLLRFWEYQEGRIWLGGQELRTRSPEQARSLFGVVSQQTHLFNATIRENLLLARPEAGQAELDRAVALAHLAGFIQQLPQGFDTWVGEQGLRLSGGERQRLAIARAVLKDTPFLLLDEATANLDPLTEQSIMADLLTLMQGRSTLMITHRLVGLEAMDEILVLHAGRVVERGRHEALLQAGGVYRRLWDLQRQVDTLSSSF